MTTPRKAKSKKRGGGRLPRLLEKPELGVSRLLYQSLDAQRKTHETLSQLVDRIENIVKDLPRVVPSNTRAHNMLLRFGLWEQASEPDRTGYLLGGGAWLLFTRWVTGSVFSPAGQAPGSGLTLRQLRARGQTEEAELCVDLGYRPDPLGEGVASVPRWTGRIVVYVWEEAWENLPRVKKKAVDLECSGNNPAIVACLLYEELKKGGHLAGMGTLPVFPWDPKQSGGEPTGV